MVRRPPHHTRACGNHALLHFCNTHTVMQSVPILFNQLDSTSTAPRDRSSGNAGTYIASSSSFRLASGMIHEADEDRPPRRVSIIILPHRPVNPQAGSRAGAEEGGLYTCALDDHGPAGRVPACPPNNQAFIQGVSTVKHKLGKTTIIYDSMHEYEYRSLTFSALALPLRQLQATRQYTSSSYQPQKHHPSPKATTCGVLTVISNVVNDQG